MISQTAQGLLVPSAALWCDAEKAPGMVFVSHAHGDHVTASPDVLCTPETAAFLAHRAPPRAASPTTVRTVRLGDTIARGDAQVSLVSAGHTMGSAMLWVHSPEGHLLYTGDFKRRPNPCAPPVVVPRCDVLVTECTFGHPRYRFPPDDETLEQLFAFCHAALRDDAVPVVCAYPFGKGQEVLHHLLGAGFPVSVHGQTASLSRVHEALGHQFPATGAWRPYVRGEVGASVLLTTPGSRRAPMVTALRRRRICLLTGWALHPGAHHLYRDCDLVLPLSDHADYDELVRTVRESGATTVYTVHGEPGFAARLREMGVQAVHLAAHPRQAPDAVQLPLAL